MAKSPWQRRKIEEQRAERRRIREGTTAADSGKLAEFLKSDYEERNGQAQSDGGNDTVTIEPDEQDAGIVVPSQEYDERSSGTSPEHEPQEGTMPFITQTERADIPASTAGRKSQTEDLRTELVPILQEAVDARESRVFRLPKQLEINGRMVDTEKVVSRALTQAGKEVTTIIDGVLKKGEVRVRRSFYPVDVEVTNDDGETATELWTEFKVWAVENS